MKKALILSLLVLVLMLTLSTAGYTQCAMCRASVGSNLSEGRGVIGTGINTGILYLLLMPYLMVAGLFLAWYRTGKKEMSNKMALANRLKEIYKK